MIQNTIRILAFLSFLLLPVFAEIGSQHTVGQITLMVVESDRDVTVFIASASATARAVEVTVISAGQLGMTGRLRLTKLVRVPGVGGRPAKLTFDTAGERVQEIRLNELTGLTSQTIFFTSTKGNYE